MRFEYYALNGEGMEIIGMIEATDIADAIEYLKGKNLFTTKLKEIKTMNLAQALKTKNRLAGELVRQQAILQRENSRRSDNVSKVDCEAIWNKIQEVSNQLGELKGKITQANIGIYTMLERMAELKSRITFIQSLPKREGVENESLGYNQPSVAYTWTSFITQEKCDAMVTDLQNQINDLQDKIDSYNSTTLLP